MTFFVFLQNEGILIVTLDVKGGGGGGFPILKSY